MSPWRRRRRRLPSVAVGCSLLLWSAGPVPAAAGKRRDRCARPGTRTLVANRYTRVYELLSSGAVLACHRSTGLRTNLGNTGAGSGPYVFLGSQTLSLRGHVVVSAYSFADGAGTELSRVVLPRDHGNSSREPGLLLNADYSETTVPQRVGVRRSVIAPNETVVLASCDAAPALAPRRCARGASVRIVAYPRRSFTEPNEPSGRKLARVLAESPRIDASTLRLSPSETRGGVG